ncbi:hypothetical protein D3C86_1505670 [compost metagenome]
MVVELIVGVLAQRAGIQALLVAQFHAAQVQYGVLHGDFHALAAPRMLALQQCAQDPDHAVHARTRIADLRARHQWHAAGFACRRCGTAHALSHVFIRLAVLVGAGTEALDRRIDHARIQVLDMFPVESGAGQHARTEVLDQHIALLNQVFQQCLAFRRFHIERQATLVAVQHGEVQAVSVGHVTQLAARDVTASGQFDLDHVGAHPGHQLRSRGAGLNVRQVQDANAVQGFALRHGAGLTLVGSLGHARLLICVSLF